MDAVLRTGLINAGLAAGLGLLALVIGRVFRRRPAVAHALWLLVLLKLLTPPLVGLPVWPAPEPEPAPEAGVLVAVPLEAGLESSGGGGEAPAEPAESPTEPWPISLAVGVVWLAGSGVYLAVVAGRLGRWSRLLRGLPEAPEDVTTLAARLGLRRVPRVLLAPGCVPPMLSAAWGPPVLVLPRALWGRLDQDQREALLLHELAHLARGDHWVRRLELAVLALYWWCPLAWWACAELRKAEEECCDAWVVWASPEAGPAYAGALIETVAFLSGSGVRLPIGACGAGPVFTLKRRLSMILRGGTPRGLSRSGLGLVALTALVLPLVPVAAEPPKAAVKPEGERDDPVGDLRHLVATLTSCQLCHGAPPGGKADVGTAEAALGARWLERSKALRIAEEGRAVLLSRQLSRNLAGHPQFHGNLHDGIVKLLYQLQNRKADVRRAEQELRGLLAEFEKQVAPRKTPEQLRIEELEKQLRRLQEELKALRDAKAALASRPVPDPERRPEPLRSEWWNWAPAQAQEERRLAELSVLLQQRKMRDRLEARNFDVVKALAGQGTGYLRSRTIVLPLRWAHAQADVRMMLVYLTTNGGQTWDHIHSIGRSADSFSTTVKADGKYGFLVLQDSEKGVKLEGRKPMVEVIVDTLPPRVALEVTKKGPRRALVKYQVTDPNLDPAGGRLEYLADGTTWVAYETPSGLTLSGELTADLEVDVPTTWRLRARDLAGNETTVSGKVK